jgi:hypothetical protein
MKSFLGVCTSLVLGVLNGFDRLVFRGHLLNLTHRDGMERLLCTNRVLFKDFKEHCRAQTKELIQASLAEAKRLERPIQYLSSCKESKEDRARSIMAKDRVEQGLIAVFKCVEPCWTFRLHRNRDTKKLEIHPKLGQCAYLYHYYLHAVFGFMHGRVQTWYPFNVQICLNGRAWLARQLDQAGLGYQRHDNKFIWLEDFSRAQQLLDQQLQINWPEQLKRILKDVHPSHPGLLGRMPMDYYWSVYQSEWASDFAFRSRADLQRLYPQWLRHAITCYSSTDVFRFLGRKLTPDGKIWARFQKEIKSSLQARQEGIRIKHWVDRNSIKMYDCSSVLRIETTINNPGDFQVYRPKQGGSEEVKDWRPMRKGVADLYRRAQVSQAANERYATAVAAVKDTTPLRDLAERLCRRAPAPGKNPQRRKVRALNPLAAEDATLLSAVLDPKFTVNGLRNRDLVALLYATPTADEKETRRRSARVTRLIRLLRAHGLLHKVPKTHRYVVPELGRKAATALLAARNANADFLTINAA